MIVGVIIATILAPAASARDGSVTSFDGTRARLVNATSIALTLPFAGG